MLTPDITIMSVGTEITYGKSMVPDHGWVELLNQKWDRNVVIEEASKFSELKPQVFSVALYFSLIFKLGEFICLFGGGKFNLFSFFILKFEMLVVEERCLL